MSTKQNKITVNIQRSKLTATTTEEMWQLYRKCYHCDYDTFLEKLKTSNYISFYKQAERIVGFICIEAVRQHLHGKNYLLLRFGQVIIDKAFRGKSLIPITGAKLCRLFLERFFIWTHLLLGRYADL